MARPRILVLTAVALALVLPAAGCGGGGDTDQFREDYNAAVDKLSSINTDIGKASGNAAGQSNDAIAKEFDRIAGTAEQTRADLSKLDPPDDAKDEFDELLAAMRKGVGDLRDVADAAKKNDPQAAQKAVRSLSQSGQDITAAEDALKKAVDG